MKVKIQWTYDIDLIWIPDIIEKDIVKYQDDFLGWVNGVSFDNRMKQGTCFGTEHFVNYLNEWVLTDINETNEKALIIAEDYKPQIEREKHELSSIKTLYF